MPSMLAVNNSNCESLTINGVNYSQIEIKIKNLRADLGDGDLGSGYMDREQLFCQFSRSPAFRSLWFVYAYVFQNLLTLCFLY